MYKLTRLNGRDFYSNSVDYASSIGKIIRVNDYDPAESGSCGRGLHASRNPNDCFVGAKIPCRAFKVKGIQKITSDSQKCRYQALKIIEEIHDLNKLFGWNYNEAINPIHPFKIKYPKITNKHKQLVQQWSSVRGSVSVSMRDSIDIYMWDSKWDNVWDSIWAFTGDSLWAFAGDSLWDSIWAFTGDSLWDSIWAFTGDSLQTLMSDSEVASMWDSVYAYIGSLFLNIKKWEYIDHKKGEYPFQSCVDLWRQGLIPSYDGKKWRLHGGPKGEVLAEFKF